MSDLIAVVGPTATGKSTWAMAIARRHGGEIVNADSRQIYRGLDIGTAKPSRAERAKIPHHCLDHVDPRERYHLGRFLREARSAIAAIHGRSHRPVLVGGTGQYVWALLEGWDVPEVAPDPEYRAALEQRAQQDGPAALHDELRGVDPAAADTILPGNVRRVIRALEVHRATGRPISSWWAARDPIPATIVAPQVNAVDLDTRIDRRVEGMFEAGLVAETQALLDGEGLHGGLPAAAPGLGSIGYRQVVAYLSGRCDLPTAIAETQQATRQLARRQRGWFRTDDRRIRWAASLDEAVSHVPETDSA